MILYEETEGGGGNVGWGWGVGGLRNLLFPISEIKEWTELLFGNLSSTDIFVGCVLTVLIVRVFTV